MLNAIASTTVAMETNRLKSNLTSRGFKRFIARLFPENRVLEVVFDVANGCVLTRAGFDRPAKHAEFYLMRELETAGEHLKLIEKKRSPKNGTVTFRIQVDFDENATHAHLMGVLVELRDLAEACADIDKSILQIG